MKTTDYYEDLPDSMSREELSQEFAEVLVANLETDAEIVSEALFALSERQWNTYELADEKLRASVSEAILKLWDDDDADRADLLLGVISRMGLGDVLRQLRKKDPSSYSKNVRNSLEEAIGEFGDTVDDPYFGMKN